MNTPKQDKLVRLLKFAGAKLLQLSILAGVLAVLLSRNYESGFVPSKDLLTIIELVAAVVGIDVSKSLIAQFRDAWDKVTLKDYP